MEKKKEPPAGEIRGEIDVCALYGEMAREEEEERTWFDAVGDGEHMICTSHGDKRTVALTLDGGGGAYLAVRNAPFSAALGSLIQRGTCVLRRVSFAIERKTRCLASAAEFLDAVRCSPTITSLDIGGFNLLSGAPPPPPLPRITHFTAGITDEDDDEAAADFPGACARLIAMFPCLQRLDMYWDAPMTANDLDGLDMLQQRHPSLHTITGIVFSVEHTPFFAVWAEQTSIPNVGFVVHSDVPPSFIAALQRNPRIVHATLNDETILQRPP